MSACYHLDPALRLEIAYPEGAAQAVSRRITVHGVVNHCEQGVVALVAWCSLERRRRMFTFEKIAAVRNDQGCAVLPVILSVGLSELIRKGGAPVDSCCTAQLQEP